MCKDQGPVAHSPKCVYRHALLLAYLAYRGMVDHEQNPKAADMVGQIPAIFKESWTQDLSLDAAEKRFMKTPFGRLTPGQRSEASWLIERLSPLAWALQISELPPCFSQIKGAKVSASLGIFQPGTEERVKTAKLRSSDEIVMAAQTYAALYWRLAEHAKGSGPIDFYEKVKDPESEHLTVDGLEFIDRDLAINGTPLHSVSQAQLGITNAIVYQRYKAFRWLLGMEHGMPTVTLVH